MTVGEDREALRLFGDAVRARAAVDQANDTAREVTISAIDAAKVAGWSWVRIGVSLGISDRGAKEYYKRNRRLVRRGNVV